MERAEAELARAGGREDDRTTWTGKRVRDNNTTTTANTTTAGGGSGIASIPAEEGERVGKYMSATNAMAEGSVVGEEWEGGDDPQPVMKKKKKLKAGTGGGGWGVFEGW